MAHTKDPRSTACERCPFPEYHDPLTAIHNHNYLKTYLEDRPQLDYTLLLLDIHDFNRLNLLHGVDAADTILKQFTALLKEFIPSNAIFSRYFSDQFFICLFNETRESIETFVQVITDMLNYHLFQIEEIFFNLQIKIGIAHIQDGVTFSKAKIALHECKQSSDQWTFYRERSFYNQYRKKYKHTYEIISQAIKDDTIIPVFQPIIDNKTNEIISFESLVRIKENETLLSPATFLPVAKECNFLPSITKIMIEKSFQTFNTTSMHFSLNNHTMMT